MNKKEKKVEHYHLLYIHVLINMAENVVSVLFELWQFKRATPITSVVSLFI